ncbi:hypothetical protein F1880_009651 [Penicillium rolfsii]|nr:hypothetical protein F1880_009651 [Penicillium rolfsii]
MPALPGFTDKPFCTYSSLARASVALLNPLEQHISLQKALVKLPVDTLAGFDDVAAQFEGYARPLWAVASLFSARDVADSLGLDLDSWYLSDLDSFDQRMVEMKTISYALLMASAAFLSGMEAIAREDLERWLRQINGREMPCNSWRWFYVPVNLARESQNEDLMAQDSNSLDFDLGEGWSSDGLRGGRGGNGLSIARKALRCDLRGCSREFASAFWRLFDVDKQYLGSAIPFKRILTYRFAFAAFWSAIAIARVQLDAHSTTSE